MKNQKPAAPAANAGKGSIDIDSIVAKARAGVPANLREIFDKAVLSGMRIMFDEGSHQMMLDELNQAGPMATRISNGIIKLVYMLWEKSNKTLPPQIIVALTLTLALRAFQFLQEAKDPEATKEVLGEATADAVQGVMDRFGATQDKIPGLVKGQGGAQPGAAPAPAAPAGTGMLDSVGGK